MLGYNCGIIPRNFENIFIGEWKRIPHTRSVNSYCDYEEIFV
jgi:hypothetical protein